MYYFENVNSTETTAEFHYDIPNSKVYGANMGSIWGRQDPGGPHVGPMNLAISDVSIRYHNIAHSNAKTDTRSGIGLPTWWRLHMETFSALLALCEGDSPVTGEFPS